MPRDSDDLAVAYRWTRRLCAYRAHAEACTNQVLRRVDRIRLPGWLAGTTGSVHAALPDNAYRPRAPRCLVTVPPLDRTSGQRSLRWTNAGHPPPLLVGPDRAVHILRTPPELLLGVHTLTARSDHTAVLPAGSTLLLYTDGLIERRGEDLADGLDRLAGVVHELAAAPLPELLHRLVEHLVGNAADDDTAILGIRVRPEAQSARPNERGRSERN